MYGIKFSQVTERRWLLASVIGLLFVVGLLDVIRIAVVTIVPREGACHAGVGCGMRR